jgi:hypothetical protein
MIRGAGLLPFLMDRGLKDFLRIFRIDFRIEGLKDFRILRIEGLKDCKFSGFLVGDVYFWRLK